MKFSGFIKDWTLIISMLAGVSGYLVYAAIPALQFTHGFANHAVGILQPLLIFAMLLLTFCRIDPRHLRFRPWHLWLILIQCGLFTAIGIVLIILPHSGLRVVLEGAMLCLICPTATAAAVITRKLGGCSFFISLLLFLHPLPIPTLSGAGVFAGFVLKKNLRARYLNLINYIYIFVQISIYETISYNHSGRLHDHILGIRRRQQLDGQCS